MAGKVIICDNNVSATGGGRGLKTVELSSYRVYRAKLSSNRTIEYIEQNCPAIEHLLQSCRVIEHIEHVLQNPTKTVEHWNRPITRQFCSIYSTDRETVELSNYPVYISSKTVELSNYRVYRAKLSSYRTIE